MAKTVLVTGASGLLGREVRRAFEIDDWKAIGTALTRPSPPEIVKLDILDPKAIEEVLDEVKPDAVIHCAANRFPDSCSANPSAAQALNVDASRTLASLTTSRKIFLIYISTDYVFSGAPGEAPYATTASPNPPNAYGKTKLDGEKAVLEVSRTSGTKNSVVVLRVPILYGSCDEPHHSAVNVLMSQLWASQNLGPSDAKIKVDDYALRYPTNTEDVARVCRDLSKLYLDPASKDRELPEVLHFSSEDCMTKWQICQKFAAIMGLPLEGMEPFRPDVEGEEKGGVKRPYDCHLDTSSLHELDGVNYSTVGFEMWWRMHVGAFRH